MLDAQLKAESCCVAGDVKVILMFPGEKMKPKLHLIKTDIFIQLLCDIVNLYKEYSGPSELYLVQPQTKLAHSVVAFSQCKTCVNDMLGLWML